MSKPYGKPRDPLVPYRIVGTPWCAIDLRAGVVALIDEEDAPKVENMMLYFRKEAKLDFGYVGVIAYGSRKDRGRAPKMKLLHRLVMNAPPGVLVDHINRDGLDCRKSNLRLCDFSLNAANKRAQNGTVSGFKGVAAADGRWRARIGGERQSLGVFPDPIAAARAYDRAALKKWGAYARLNFPRGDYPDFEEMGA